VSEYREECAYRIGESQLTQIDRIAAAWTGVIAMSRPTSTSEAAAIDFGNPFQTSNNSTAGIFQFSAAAMEEDYADEQTEQTDGEVAKTDYSKEEIAEFKETIERVTGEITGIQQNLGYRKRYAMEQKKETEDCIQKLKEESVKLEFQEQKMKALQAHTPSYPTLI